MLICCHDGGYVPVLRPYAAQEHLLKRITLVSAGGIYPQIASLGFRQTARFEPLFSATGSPKPAPTVRFALPEPEEEKVRPSPVLTDRSIWGTYGKISPAEREANQSQPSPVLATPTTPANDFIPRPRGVENFVANADRLGPVLRNSAGQRMDKKLSCSTYDERVQRIRNLSLCSWHYLRSDHPVTSCKRSHDVMQRPLSSHDYDALWLVTREGGYCNRLKKEGEYLR